MNDEFMAKVYFSRRCKLQEKLKKKKIDALLITAKDDLFYLSGFPHDGYWGLITKSVFFLLLPPLLFEQARQTIKEEGVSFFAAKDTFSLLRKLAKRERLRTLLFDSEKTTCRQREKLKEIPGIKFFGEKDLLSNLREVKDQSEIEKIRKACKLVVQGCQYVRKILRPGMAEHELANEIEYYLRKNGAEKMSFEIIVASGENTAYPHHLTSERVFRKSDPVLVDLGVIYQGYCSDLTRTFFLGKIDKNLGNIYSIVKRAQEKAIQTVKPGLPIQKVAWAALRVVQGAGYGKYFLHNLGHGIGINIHESPLISARVKKVLKPGMVFTIEPGIYIPRLGGVRIEDVVLVTDNGYEVLTE